MSQAQVPSEVQTDAQAQAPAAPAPAPAQQAPQSADQSNNGPPQSASLYVGELDPTVTEAMLFEIFNMIGPVASIRVCRDAVTRRSLGYAYVNYLNLQDGERALEQLNYSLIKNRACRIMWSQRDPALRKTGQGNIFIKNLDEAIDNKALHDTFAAFGNVLSCKVATDENGNSRGYGFVHYENGESATAAIQHVNGMLLNDKKVYVGHHVSKKERQAKIDEQKSQFTNVFIKNLDVSVDDEKFKQILEPYGDILSAVVQKDDQGHSRGFGFVNYKNHEEAAKAVDSLNEVEVEGKRIFAARAQKKTEREEELRRNYEQAKLEKMAKYAGVNLYVKNLDDDFDDERLIAEFEPFGTITSAKIMKDEKGASKGFGFVCFSSPDEATKAVSELSGKMIGSKPLYVSLAQRRDVRRQQLESQIAQRNQLRLQHQAAAGVPISGFMPGAPMYYQPPPGAYPGGRSMYGQPGFAPPRPRGYPAGQQVPGMPIPSPYGPPPQGYMPANYRPARPARTNGAQVQGGSPAPNVRPAVPAGTGPGPRPAGVPVRPTQGGKPAKQEAGQLSASVLANAPPAEQKQMLGEALYPKIFNIQPELAGKITGMLLEMENSELLFLLENEDALRSKVEEAIAVLNEYQDDEPPSGAGEDAGDAAEPTA